MANLGTDSKAREDTKEHYKFPYGDFEKVHRCGVLSAEVRAGQRKYADIEASGQVDSVRPDYIGPRILEAANDVFADLIVVGGHHHDTVKERLLGDLGKTLAHGATCPVLMMPSIGM